MGLLYPFAGVLLNPILAASAKVLSSVSMGTNALRLRRFEPPGLIVGARGQLTAATPAEGQSRRRRVACPGDAHAWARVAGHAQSLVTSRSPRDRCGTPPTPAVDLGLPTLGHAAASN
jgi:hypothetical protein